MIFFFLKENLEIVAPSGIKGMKMKSCIDSQQLKNSVWDSILLTSTICCKKFKLLGQVQFCSNSCPLGFSLPSSLHHVRPSLRPCPLPVAELELHWSIIDLGLPGVSVGKNLPAHAGDALIEAWTQGSTPRSGQFPGEENGNSLLYSCLEDPKAKEPGRLQPMGSQKCWIQLSDWTATTNSWFTMLC